MNMRDPRTFAQQKTVRGYQHQLKACTGTGAQMNTAKHKRMQTPDRCTRTIASQNTAGDDGMPTQVNALACEQNNDADPQGNTDILSC